MDKKYFLTPSKASKLYQYASNWAFFVNYVLKDKPESSGDMEKGRRLHNLFYGAMEYRISASLSKELPIFLEEPKKYAPKKECGVSIEDQKAAFDEKEKVNMEEGIGPYVVRQSDAKVFSYIQWWLYHSDFLKKRNAYNLYEKGEVKFETDIDDGKGLHGIFDLMIGDRIIDVKTTKKIIDKGLSKWKAWKPLAIQELIYKDIFKAVNGREPESFEFLYIQTCWPYEIKVFSLPSNVLGMTRVLLSEIMRRYDVIRGMWMKTLEKAEKIKTAYPDKIPEVKYMDFGAETNLISNSTEPEEMEINHYELRELKLEVSKIEKQLKYANLRI